MNKKRILVTIGIAALLCSLISAQVLTQAMQPDVTTFESIFEEIIETDGIAYSSESTETVETWNIETLDIFYYGCSIAIDSDNYPHIAYHCFETHDLIYVRWDGTGWLFETVESSGMAGTYPSLALDSGDNPHISYQISYPTEALKYAKWNGTGWEIDAVETQELTGYYTAIVLDSNDYPHISYYDSLNEDVKYAKWTGTKWITKVVDPDMVVWDYTDIAIDSADNPHICYIDYTNDDLKYAKWNGTVWEIDVVDAGDVIESCSIVMDSNDHPHISYTIDFAPGIGLNYAFWNGTDWELENVESEVGYEYQSACSIALDSGDNPHIGYGTDGSDMKYARWTGSDWSIEVVDPNGDFGSYLSFALGPYDDPHISYVEFIETNVNYLRYTYKAIVNVTLSPSSQTVTAGSSTRHTLNYTMIRNTLGNASLSLDLPQTVGDYSFTPNSGIPDFSSTLIINTWSTAPPGTYNLTVSAVGNWTIERDLTLTVSPKPMLTLFLIPETVPKGSQLTIAGKLTPDRAAPIRLYYRRPHETGVWKLAMTLQTNENGVYYKKVTIPFGVPSGEYDWRAVWFDADTGSYASSPLTFLTIT